jgi:hypothetical protein
VICWSPRARSLPSTTCCAAGDGEAKQIGMARDEAPTANLLLKDMRVETERQSVLADQVSASVPGVA